MEKIIINDQESLKKDKLFQLAASVDFHSEHFIAKAIASEAKKQKIPLLPARNFSAMAGFGVKAEVGDKKIYLGGASLLNKFKVRVEKQFKKIVDKENQQGKTVVFVLQDNDGQMKLLGGLSLADQIRKEAREAIKQLKGLGIRSAMITGDSEPVAKWVAKETGINQYFAHVLPHKKAEKVKTFQDQGQKVAFVGDGINDAPALSQADLGIAIGAGTNVAIESAGIILVKNNPLGIIKIINLSRATYRKMLENLFWATGYNILALPLAAGILAFKGIILPTATAAIFMSISTIVVAFNALMLKKIQL